MAKRNEGLIWVTGATGYTGRHLLDALRKTVSPSRIIAISRSGIVGDDDVVHIRLDLTNPQGIADLANKLPPAQVYHLAAAMPPADEQEMWSVFVMATYMLITSLHAAGCHETRIICAGSAAEFLPGREGRYSELSPIGGISPYGRAKSAQTILSLETARRLGMQLVIGRPFNLIGPGLPTKFVLGTICSQLAQGADTLKLGNVDSERDFVDVRDVASAYVALMESDLNLDVFNICTGNATAIKALIDIASRLLHVSPELIVDKNRIKSNDIDRVYGTYERLNRATGWAPSFELERSIADTIREYQK